MKAFVASCKRDKNCYVLVKAGDHAGVVQTQATSGCSCILLISSLAGTTSPIARRRKR